MACGVLPFGRSVSIEGAWRCSNRNCPQSVHTTGVVILKHDVAILFTQCGIAPATLNGPEFAKVCAFGVTRTIVSLQVSEPCSRSLKKCRTGTMQSTGRWHACRKRTIEDHSQLSQ